MFAEHANVLQQYWPLAAAYTLCSALVAALLYSIFSCFIGI